MSTEATEKSVIGRCGRVATGTGHVVAVDDTGLYYKFRRPGKNAKARWYHRDDVKLHAPRTCGRCGGAGKNEVGAPCSHCDGSGVHEFRVTVNPRDVL